MGIDLNKGFEELLQHKGHNVTLSSYDKDGEVWNMAIECLTCMEVLLDFDNPKVN